jgi:hypothetical protein
MIAFLFLYEDLCSKRAEEWTWSFAEFLAEDIDAGAKTSGTRLVRVQASSISGSVTKAQARARDRLLPCASTRS